MWDRRPRGPEGYRDSEWRVRSDPGATPGGFIGPSPGGEASECEDVSAPCLPEKPLAARISWVAVDCLIGGAVWAAAVALACSAVGGSAKTLLRVKLFTAFGVPTIAMLWFPLRMAPTIGRLSRRDLRESLALSRLDAHEFLKSNLQPGALRSMVPLLILLPMLGAFLAWFRFMNSSGGVIETFMVFLECAILALAILAHLASGALTYLMRLCVRPPSSGDALFRFYAWNFYGLVIVWFILWCGIYPFLALLVAGGALAQSLDVAYRRWMQVGRYYFLFEDIRDPGDMPGRITATERGVRSRRFRR